MRSFAAIAATVLAAACHASPAPAGAPATCAQVADHVQAMLPKGDDHGGEHARKVRDVIERRCRLDHWTADVTTCMFDEHDLHSGHHCQDQLTAEQRTAFTHEVAAIDLPPAPPKLPLPTECDDYKSAIEAMANCQQIPMEARRQMVAALAQISAAWTDAPPETRQSLAASCKVAADAVRQGLATVCPPPP